MPALDDWDYPGLRAACVERCAEFGDPPCHALRRDGGCVVNADAVQEIKPCGECWRDVGVEPGDEFDEHAAVARLL